MYRWMTAAALAFAGTLAMTGCGQSQEIAADYIGIEAAQSQALKAAGVDEADADFDIAGLDQKNGIFYYQIHFDALGNSYEYAIDALTGSVIEEQILQGEQSQERESTAALETESPAGTDAFQETESPAGTAASQETETTAGVIDQETALKAALDHAGLESGQISRLEVERDYDHGQAVYEISFRDPQEQEYEYQIDALTGEILSYDFDMKGGRRNRGTEASGSMLTEDQVREKVLARVPGASAEDVFLRLEQDDGRMEYDGTLVYQGMEYEFKIDAYSGDIREWEADKL